MNEHHAHATLEVSDGESTASHMRAARCHRHGEPFAVDTIEKPSPRSTDVLIQVQACGMVHNLINVLDPNIAGDVIQRPALPAIYGLDAAGVIVETGPQVHGLEVGDRVYVNPLRYCGSCRSCRVGRVRGCNHLTLSGYLGSGPRSSQMLAEYPYGGYAEFMTAPQYSLVKLPDVVSFETAARWGYFGTSYSALRRANVNMSTTVLIDGISGTLGLGAALFALALGAPMILGVGRDLERLERVKAIAPDRIHVLSTSEGASVADWARSLTGGDGVDVVIDALPTGCAGSAFLAAAAALAREGVHVNIGSVLENVPLNMFSIMNAHQSYVGSFWFTTPEGQEMADLAASGSVKLDVLDHEVFGLDDINEALGAIARDDRDGGFTNFVIAPKMRNVAESSR